MKHYPETAYTFIVDTIVGPVTIDIPAVAYDEPSMISMRGPDMAISVLRNAVAGNGFNMDGMPVSLERSRPMDIYPALTSCKATGAILDFQVISGYIPTAEEISADWPEIFDNEEDIEQGYTEDSEDQPIMESATADLPFREAGFLSPEEFKTDYEKNKLAGETEQEYLDYAFFRGMKI